MTTSRRYILAAAESKSFYIIIIISYARSKTKIVVAAYYWIKCTMYTLVYNSVDLKLLSVAPPIVSINQTHATPNPDFVDSMLNFRWYLQGFRKRSNKKIKKFIFLFFCLVSVNVFRILRRNKKIRSPIWTSSISNLNWSVYAQYATAHAPHAHLSSLQFKNLCYNCSLIRIIVLYEKSFK